MNYGIILYISCSKNLFQAAKIQTDIDTLIQNSKALGSMPENFWIVLQEAGKCFEESYLEAKTNAIALGKEIVDCFTGRNVTTEFPNI